MRLILALATKGFVSSFDEEDYDWVSIFGRESDNELYETDDEFSEEDSICKKMLPVTISRKMKEKFLRMII